MDFCELSMAVGVNGTGSFEGGKLFEDSNNTASGC
jgi:hypothetical protein